MAIGELAGAESGIPASTIRYWERIGVLPKPIRVSGQRRFAPPMLFTGSPLLRLARACGFRLDEMRHLLHGFGPGIRPPRRWQEVARRKQRELDEQIDALSLVERIDTVKGEVPGTAGDRQFRIYVRLTPTAREWLQRSREFKRAADNSVYHKGYPLNYREQGTPSIQVYEKFMALDGRLADIDVDYRSSSFPSMLFNGHLSASNSRCSAPAPTTSATRRADTYDAFEAVTV